MNQINYQTTKSVLKTVTLKSQVPLVITEKLQLQIKYLCQKESTVEWSGVLFYTTEGEFGKPGFKCIAEELLLMDIGTGAYTEYQYDTAFVSIMMKNPHLMKMRRGHIHSHNNMAVFFSGTDTTEIVDNSEHYDYYLSLIVNNRNEMVAKIAFRANLVDEGVKKVYYKKVFNEEIKSSFEENYKNEEECVMVYDCAIEGQEPVIGVDEKFIERYQLIKKEKAEKTSTKSFHTKESWNNYDRGNASVGTSYYGSYYPGKKEKLVQTDLFGGVKDQEVDTEFEVDEEEATAIYEQALEEFVINTCIPNSHISTVDTLLRSLKNQKNSMSEKQWGFDLQDMQQSLHWAYLQSFDDSEFKHFDQTLNYATKLIEEKNTYDVHDIVHDLKTKVFVKK